MSPDDRPGPAGHSDRLRCRGTEGAGSGLQRSSSDEVTDEVADIGCGRRMAETIDMASISPPPIGSTARETARYGDAVTAERRAFHGVNGRQPAGREADEAQPIAGAAQLNAMLLPPANADRMRNRAAADLVRWRSWVEASKLLGLRHARHRDRVRRQPRVDAPLGMEIPHLIECAPEHVTEASRDLCLRASCTTGGSGPTRSS